MMVEKSRYPRYNVTVSVAYLGQDDTDSGNVQSKNISTAGICLSSKQPMKKGDIVELTFYMATETIHAKGKVVWSERILPHLFDNGIEFISISDEHLKVIEKYINTQ